MHSGKCAMCIQHHDLHLLFVAFNSKVQATTTKRGAQTHFAFRSKKGDGEERKKEHITILETVYKFAQNKILKWKLQKDYLERMSA